MRFLKREMRCGLREMHSIRQDSVPTNRIACVTFSTKLPTPVENCPLWITDQRKILSKRDFLTAGREYIRLFHSVCEKLCEKDGIYRKKTKSPVRMHTAASCGIGYSAGYTYSAPRAAS